MRQAPKFTFSPSNKSSKTDISSHGLPQIDRSRIVAVYVRQSGTGSDTAHGESRETQLGMIEYAYKLLGFEQGVQTDLIRMYDEGAGQSGRKRIDQRPEIARLYNDISSGIIGTVIVAREDRLFRDKHGDQSGLYTELAERKKVLTIVPPVVTKHYAVYDMSNYEDLRRFKDKMQAASDYLEDQIRYMHANLKRKSGKGEYDGRHLPPGLVITRNGTDKPVIYQPWAKVMKRLLNRARELNWNWPQLNKEVDALPFLFPEPTEQDKYMYIFNIGLDPKQGYKPRQSNTIRGWFKNVLLIGWWPVRNEVNEVILDNHPAMLDKQLFEEAYINLTGYSLDGELIQEKPLTQRRKQEEKDLPEALFHGRMETEEREGEYTRVGVASFRNGNHRPFYDCITYSKKNRIKYISLFSVSCADFDALIVDRLLELAQADANIYTKIQEVMKRIHEKQVNNLVAIDDQIARYGIEIPKLRKNLATLACHLDEGDETLVSLATKLREDEKTLRDLENEKKKRSTIDGEEEIKEFYDVLIHFQEAYPKLPLHKKHRLFSILVSRIELSYVSPRWLLLKIEWLTALKGRPDVALVWRNNPKSGEDFSCQEETILREHYTYTPILDLLQLLPSRSWRTIQRQAVELGIRRKKNFQPSIPRYCCFQDLAPYGQFLFGSLEETTDAIQESIANTHKSSDTLYAHWLLPEDVREMILF